MPSLEDIRPITALACRACAALLPLSSDGIGADSHGGQIQNPEAALDRALVALIRAGELAGQIRAAAGEHPE